MELHYIHAYKFRPHLRSQFCCKLYSRIIAVQEDTGKTHEGIEQPQSRTKKFRPVPAGGRLRMEGAWEVHEGGERMRGTCVTVSLA